MEILRETRVTDHHTLGGISTGLGGRLRVLVVAESFLPQVNGVTNSVRRVLEHLAAEGHAAELIAPTGPNVYAGFPVTRARGAALPFYRDFRIGIETRRRLRAVMLRFRPDVVHIASPAALGYQAARTATFIPTAATTHGDAASRPTGGCSWGTSAASHRRRSSTS